MDEQEQSAGQEPRETTEPDDGMEPDALGEPEPAGARAGAASSGIRGPRSGGAGPRSGGGAIGAALTGRGAGWAVATLMAGALTGLAVNVATAPSTTVVQSVGAVGAVGAGHAVRLSPVPAGPFSWVGVPGVLQAPLACKAAGVLAPPFVFRILPGQRAVIVRRGAVVKRAILVPQVPGSSRAFVLVGPPAVAPVPVKTRMFQLLPVARAISVAPGALIAPAPFLHIACPG